MQTAYYTQIVSQKANAMNKKKSKHTKVHTQNSHIGKRHRSLFKLVVAVARSCAAKRVLPLCGLSRGAAVDFVGGELVGP